jgi:molybdopterin synthase catalytic subunit
MRVLYFAATKDLLKREHEDIELTENTTTPRELRQLLLQQHPQLEGLLKTCLLAVNMEYVHWDDELTIRHSDEVAIIPPVSVTVSEVTL